MHTSRQLRSDHFGFTVAGQAGSLEAVFPGFDEHDRLGVVIASDYGGAGASTVILAAVTAFYDHLRALGDDFFAYPDFFAFHVGRPRGSLRKFDIYPAHKEIVVGDDPQLLLEAINDRGITRLLLEEGDDADTAAPELSRESRASALERIRSALRYSGTGRVPEPDVIVRGSAQTEAYVEAMLAGAADDRPGETAAAAAIRRAARAAVRHAAVLQDGRPVETFRRISPDQALHALGASAGADSG